MVLQDSCNLDHNRHIVERSVTPSGARSAVCTARTEFNCGKWEPDYHIVVKQTELSTLFDRDCLRRSITNWGRNSDRMMSMQWILMVQPLSSLSKCVRSKAHLKVCLAILHNFGSKPNCMTKIDGNVEHYTCIQMNRAKKYL
jgi:hypothetical protein